MIRSRPDRTDLPDGGIGIDSVEVGFQILPCFSPVNGVHWGSKSHSQTIVVILYSRLASPRAKMLATYCNTSVADSSL